MKKGYLIGLSVLVIMFLVLDAFSFARGLGLRICLPGYSSSVGFTGASFIHGPCEKNAQDTGKVCKENNDCTSQACIPNSSYQKKCSGSKSCVGVTGTCAPIEGDQNSPTIPKKDTIEIRMFR